MYSVTKICKRIKQPYGGYLKPSSFDRIVIDDSSTLYDQENIHASIVGSVVDYMTRLMLGRNKEDAFRVALAGSSIIGQREIAEELVNKINGTDSESIISACKLVGFDVCFRSSPFEFKPINDINPDIYTVENIRIMINRSLKFFDVYGPIVEEGIIFPGGYTRLISSGDADFMTADTLWDFKVSKNAITSKHTLQILIYYIMGCHSNNNHFKKINKLGFFNPRLNTVYEININNIPLETIAEIENKVIGYNGNDIIIIKDIKRSGNSELKRKWLEHRLEFLQNAIQRTQNLELKEKYINDYNDIKEKLDSLNNN